MASWGCRETRPGFIVSSQNVGCACVGCACVGCACVLVGGLWVWASVWACLWRLLLVLMTW